MKLLLIPIIFVSVSISAQKTEKKLPSLRIDTLKTKSIELNQQNKKQPKNIYKILVAKPKDTAIYSCLKVKIKDNTDYKVLNATPSEKIKALPK